MTEPKLTTVWAGGRRKLGKDPVFGPWVKHIGTIRLPVSEVTPFYYLVRAICYQQLATKAAQTIHGRVVEALKGDVSPQKALRVRESTLRGAGLSAAKCAAVRDLATKIRSGEVEVHDLDEQPDEEIIQRLVTVRGIGVWTGRVAHRRPRRTRRVCEGARARRVSHREGARAAWRRIQSLA